MISGTSYNVSLQDQRIIVIPIMLNQLMSVLASQPSVQRVQECESRLAIGQPERGSAVTLFAQTGGEYHHTANNPPAPHHRVGMKGQPWCEVKQLQSEEHWTFSPRREVYIDTLLSALGSPKQPKLLLYSLASYCRVVAILYRAVFSISHESDAGSMAQLFCQLILARSCFCFVLTISANCCRVLLFARLGTK